MAGKGSTTKAPAKASTTSAEKAAPVAAPAAAEQLDNQPAAPTKSEAPGSDAGSSGQEAHPAALGGLGDDGDIEGLWVVALPEQGFRRCGFRFTREGFGIALDALTAEQIEQLENEPNLKVERGIFSGRVGERQE